MLLAFLALAPAQDPLFEDVSDSALPGVVTVCGSPSKDVILEVNGGGVALEDFDGDGDVDLVIVDGSTLARVAAGEPGLPPRLFLNDGSGRFEVATGPWSMVGGRWGTGVAVGDVNGDGWPDLFVAQWGPDRLLLNDGGEGWREVSEVAGLGGDGWSTSAAFADFDGDGHLDLFVARYLDFDPARIAPAGVSDARWKGHAVMEGPEGLEPLPDRLLRGRGDGTFEDVTERLGGDVRAAFGLGVVTLDADLDGDTDVYVANDSMPNHLWLNAGDGTFRESGFERGVAYDTNGREQAGMGVAGGDVDGDGRTDLFVTNFSGESNALYLSSARRAGWRERSARARLTGPSLTRLGWGTGFADLDLDGDLDLWVLNGHVYPQADRPGTDTSYAQGDQLFLQGAEGRFAEERLVDAPVVVSRAGAAADLDGDGDLDLVALSVEGQVRVLANRAADARDRHWLRVRLATRVAGSSGIGGSVEIEWAGGARRVELRSAAGFQAAQPVEAHFGLGAATRVERVRVRFPSGSEVVLEDVEGDRLLVVEEPAQDRGEDGR